MSTLTGLELFTVFFKKIYFSVLFNFGLIWYNSILSFFFFLMENGFEFGSFSYDFYIFLLIVNIGDKFGAYTASQLLLID